MFTGMIFMAPLGIYVMSVLIGFMCPKLCHDDTVKTTPKAAPKAQQEKGTTSLKTFKH
jgi:hypothetical protein